MKLKPSQLKIIIMVIILVLAYAFFYTIRRTTQDSTAGISTYEECVAAGYPILESYPERCNVPGGGSYTRVTTDISPSPITVSGTYTCLPKKDTGGPVTLECALGLQADSGYYALDNSAILSDNYPELYGNETIEVEGNLVPIEMISSDRFQTYDVIGVISVEKITVN